MKKFLEYSISPLVVGCIASLLVISDSMIAPIFAKGTSFTWVAFITWTVFFSATVKERFKAVIGFVIGFIAADTIMILGNLFNNIICINIVNVTLGVVFAVFLVNALVMYLDKAKRFFVDSIPGIFVGIALTFSGLGIKLFPSDNASGILMLCIIITYGILGLACGFFTNYFVDMLKKEKINSK